MSSTAPPLGKALASNDKKTRDKAVKSLRKFLSAGQSLDTAVPLESEAPPTPVDWEAPTQLEARFSALELQKLWKALFYCMWMSDKPLVQQKLADDLADLVLCIRSSHPGRIARTRASLVFLEAFWSVIIREWAGLDRLRMDKYYRLLRRYMVATFRLLAREGWDRHAVRDFNAIVAGPNGPFDSTNPKVLLSIHSHVAEVYPDALAEALTDSSAGDDETSAAVATSSAPIPILDLMQPAIKALCCAPQKSHFSAVFDNLLEPLLLACDSVQDESQRSSKKRRVDDTDQQFSKVLQNPLCDTDGQPLDAVDVQPKLLQIVFEAASQPTVPDGNRRRLYKLYRERMSEESQDAANEEQ